MSQPDLFAGMAEAAPPAYRPDPDKVRARLERIVGQARAATTLPWEPTRVSLYRTIVPDMARWLPSDEAAGWCEAFDAEMARLEATI
ncbi:MAG TPA: hypothetical protein VII73_14325 [Caulobacteraceae bacterium]